MKFFAGLLSLYLAQAASAAEQATPKDVLILYSFSDRSAQISADRLKSVLRDRALSPINFDVEYMETRRFDDKGYEKSQVEALRRTYGQQKLDLLITLTYPALEFTIRHRDELFPDVPIIFSDIDVNRIAEQTRWPGVTGVTETVDVRGTIDLALRLHPRTSTVAIVSGDSSFDRYWLAVVHSELTRDQDRLRVIDLVGLPPGELMKQVAALSPQTVILFQAAPQESIQPAIGTYDMLAAFGQRFPTYCIFPSECLNHGGIGGVDVDYNEQASLAADLARQVLAGVRPESIPLVHGSGNRTRVDWRQLQRWNIPESALPPGSEVLYREPTFWERDRKYFLVILAQALWIVALLWQRARKRKADSALKESEGRFQRMANTTPSLVWMCDGEGKVTYLNDTRIEFTGRDPSAGYDDVWTKYIHPDDIEAVLSANALGLERHEKFSKQYRLRRKDGVYRWMFDVAAPRVNGDGSFAGFIGSAADITDQKLAQEALEKVGGQLIEAQEKERSRIARDLHDDICQRLAILSVELEQAGRNGVPPSTKKKLEEIEQHCAEITTDIQSLSHQLHSSKLDYLGLVEGTRAFCDELSNQFEVNVHFRSNKVPRALPKDISLCLFRIMQEALHNALKYSGVREFEVDLRGTAEAVQLEVRDAGVGFEVDVAKRGAGLGLVSMQERVHVLRGKLRVESRPGAGTTVLASVPFIAANERSPGAVKDWRVAV